jgi:DNA-binding YbaB/EbfC family protein
MKGLGDLMKQAQAMQSRIEEAQSQLQDVEVVGESGAGLVRVTLSGRYEARGVEIDDSLLSEDKNMLEDLVAAAFNDAVHRVEVMQKEKMSAFTKGLGFPPGLGLPF